MSFTLAFFGRKGVGKEVSTEVRVALVTFTSLPKVKAMGFPSDSVHCMAMSEGKMNGGTVVGNRPVEGLSGFDVDN